MAYFSSDFTASSEKGDGDDDPQHLIDDDHQLGAISDPTLLDGPVSQPGRRGLLRRIELRLGSVS